MPKKRMGPRTEPCGIPDETGIISRGDTINDHCLFFIIQTRGDIVNDHCLFSIIQTVLIHLRTSPLMP